MYSRVPIRRGVRNKRSGTQDEKCIGRNISHMCLGLYSRCRFILTNLYLKVLHFDILIQLKGTAHFLENVLGLIKGVCRINVPCLLIGTREYVATPLFTIPLSSIEMLDVAFPKTFQCNKIIYFLPAAYLRRE